MTTESATQTLARWVVDLRYEDIPADVVAYAKDLILDHLGCAARGSTFANAASVRTALTAMGAYDGELRTTVVGDQPARPEWAIFTNGTTAHSIEMDDTHSASSLHPAVVVIPSALATAELEGSDGRALITAIVAGYEIACRIGRALVPSEVYAKGFHPTAIVGTFASAAATGRLLGLDAVQLAHAFGIAASQSAGRTEFFAEGAWTKRMHPGWSCMAGYTAARLASAGFTGPVRALEGRDGLLRAYGSADHVERATRGLGAPFELAETSVKPYACCRYNQGPIDLAIGLAAEHGLTAADIADVEVEIVTTAIGIVVDPPERKVAPTNDVDAQFSLQYSVALGLVLGRAGLDEYTHPTLDDPDVLAVARTVRATASPRFDAIFPELWGCSVTVTTTAGRTFSAETETPKGDPRNRLTPAEAQAKFRGLAGRVYGEETLAAIEAAVATLEDGGVAPLTDALAGARVA